MNEFNRYGQWMGGPPKKSTYSEPFGQIGNNMSNPLIKIFLRTALSSAFLSAVADRLGMWGADVSVWGNWQNFLDYTALINPWIPDALIPTLGMVVTVLEVLFAIGLIIGLKTELFARLSGFLLLLFALSMTFSTGIKGAFDFSVFTAAVAAFALSTMKEKYWEVDSLISRRAK